MNLRVAPALHSALYYYGLAHLDLGRDAANLYHAAYLATAGSIELKRVAAALRARYLGLADPLWLQVLPLRWRGAEALSQLLTCLREGGPEIPAAEQARAFARCFAEALAREEAAFVAGPWAREQARLQPLVPTLERALGEQLPLLLAGWSEHLVLELQPCPAVQGTGRSLRSPTSPSEVTVATHVPDDAADHPALLFHLLHELTHYVTDPLLAGQCVEQRAGQLAWRVEPHAEPRATRVGVPGYARHWRLEQGVLAWDYHLLKRRCPRLLPDYLSWCAPWVVRGSLEDLRRQAQAAGINPSDLAWRSLVRVARREPLRAAEAALEDWLLVDESARAAVEARLVVGASPPRHAAAPA